MKILKRTLGFFYYVINRYLLEDEHKSNVGFWFYKDGDNNYLCNYPLNENSVVFDIGGYKGIFSEKILKKYQCKLFIFEPVKEYYNYLIKKFKNYKSVKIYNFGLGGENRSDTINLCDDGSSIYKETGRKESINIVDISDFLNGEKIREVDLISINIEGGEYELLERVIESNKLATFKFIQVQFHTMVKNFEKKRENIVSMILITHKIAFSFPFLWESFIRKDKDL